jgi:hypothetical protein
MIWRWTSPGPERELTSTSINLPIAWAIRETISSVLASRGIPEIRTQTVESE